MRFAFTVLVSLAFFCGSESAFAQGAVWQGRPLAEYLDALNHEDHRILYSSDLVTGDMRLAVEPDKNDPLAGLADLLRPFGLGAEPGPAGSLLITRATGAPAYRPAPEAKPDEVPIPEIVVTSSLHRLEYANPTTHTYLDRDLATRIPQTAEESVRLTHRLPGTASGGVSSQSYVRGGEANETLFLLDGLRLYEPYHLKDFQTITTIISGNAIGGMDFHSGAYPARYGDRMSGVLDIALREPEESLETELAVSFFNASVLSMGEFGDERQGDWLVMARRGNLDLIADVIDSDIGSPDYQDYLAHLAWEFGPRARISANLLVSEDKLSLFDRDRGEEARADYTNQVFWLKWQAEWTAFLRSDTIVAISDITDRRNGVLALPGIVSGSLSDNGEFRALEFRQDWSWVAADNWMVRFGVNLKDLDAEYRFSSQQVVEAPFDTILDNLPMTVRDFELEAAGAQYAAYGEFRWRPSARWTIDLGLRWDQQN
ncbi:MAG: TonB-dependent receptor, partial [Gammaproteobacteria bacterium]|nr:TonB-dependent receptor [Gammaproteobacteria bacterium]